MWWWRPLAYLIEDKCKDFLTDEQRKSLHYNDGKEYSDKVATKIANRLQEVLDSGELEELKKRHDAEMQKAKEHNDILESKIKVIQDAHKGIAPKNFPKEEYTNWKALQEQKNWASSYPFEINNVKEFILFARCSGGFSIC